MWNEAQYKIPINNKGARSSIKFLPSFESKPSRVSSLVRLQQRLPKIFKWLALWVTIQDGWKQLKLWRLQTHQRCGNDHSLHLLLHACSRSILKNGRKTFKEWCPVPGVRLVKGQKVYVSFAASFSKRRISIPQLLLPSFNLSPNLFGLTDAVCSWRTSLISLFQQVLKNETIRGCPLNVSMSVYGHNNRMRVDFVSLLFCF